MQVAESSWPSGQTHLVHDGHSGHVITWWFTTKHSGGPSNWPKQFLKGEQLLTEDSMGFVLKS